VSTSAVGCALIIRLFVGRPHPALVEDAPQRANGSKASCFNLPLNCSSFASQIGPVKWKCFPRPGPSRLNCNNLDLTPRSPPLPGLVVRVAPFELKGSALHSYGSTDELSQLPANRFGTNAVILRSASPSEKSMQNAGLFGSPIPRLIDWFCDV